MGKLRQWLKKLQERVKKHPAITWTIVCASVAIIITVVYVSVTAVQQFQAKANPQFVDENHKITFADENFEKVVRKELKRPHGDIYLLELAQIKQLTIKDNTEICDISDLQYFMDLEKLEITGTQVRDISALSGLVNLTDLNLSNNQIRSIEPLSNLDNLVNLTLLGNTITDLSPIYGLEDLETLDVSQNNIREVGEKIQNLYRLRSCDISNNRVSSLAAFSGMGNLQILKASNNKLTEVPTFENMLSLTELSLGGNAIQQIESLGEVPSLEVLSLSRNLIGNLDFAPDCLQLKELNISYNDVKNLSPLSQCYNLALLHVEGTLVEDQTPLHNLSYFSAIYLDPDFDRTQIDFMVDHFSTGDFETKKYIIDQKHDLL